MLNKNCATYLAVRNEKVEDQMRALSLKVGFIHREFEGGYIQYKTDIPKPYTDLRLIIDSELFNAK